MADICQAVSHNLKLTKGKAVTFAYLTGVCFPRWVEFMDIYLIDGTYELFRYFYAVPSSKEDSGQEIGAVRGVLGSILTMIEGGATHVGVATDHVIESFRNDLYPGYKTGEGVDAALLSQFSILEKALQSMGVLVWPMVKFEADDALASAAAKAAKDKRVRQVIICTPDKDLSQCVVGSRVVQLDRRREILRDEAGVIAKFGIKPSSIPDYLAMVGDSADGYPGIPGWGSKAAAAVFSRYRHLEDVPKRPLSIPTCTPVMTPYSVEVFSRYEASRTVPSQRSRKVTAVPRRSLNLFGPFAALRLCL